MFIFTWMDTVSDSDKFSCFLSFFFLSVEKVNGRDVRLNRPDVVRRTFCIVKRRRRCRRYQGKIIIKNRLKRLLSGQSSVVFFFPYVPPRPNVIVCRSSIIPFNDLRRPCRLIPYVRNQNDDVFGLRDISTVCFFFYSWV